MTPADRRITELIDKWLASIDLHLKYVELSDAAYARVQAWPKHDRPTRWVLEVARQKILELKAQCETRQAMGDGKFSESLELMAFLANLVGIQHIQRFVPLADPSRTEPVSSTTATVESCSRRAPYRRRSRGLRRRHDAGDAADQGDYRRPPPARSGSCARPAGRLRRSAPTARNHLRGPQRPLRRARLPPQRKTAAAECGLAGQDHCGRHPPAEVGQVVARAGGADRAHRRTPAGRRDPQGAAREPQRRSRRRPASRLSGSEKKAGDFAVTRPVRGIRGAPR